MHRWPLIIMTTAGLLAAVLARAADQPVIDWLGGGEPSAPLSVTLTEPPGALQFSPLAPNQRLLLTFQPRPAGVLAADTVNGSTPPPWSLEVSMLEHGGEWSRAVGEIQCRSGHPGRHGFAATGCRFTPLAATLKADAHFQPAAGLGIEIGAFHSSAGTVQAFDLSGPSAAPGTINAALFEAAAMLPYSDRTAPGSGLTLALDSGFGLGALGRLETRLGIAEYLDPAEPEAMTAIDLAPLWLDSDVRREARLEIDWQLGAFSSTVEGVRREYRDNQDPGGDIWTGFNLYFSWQTPWRGRFSVGASNVLDQRTDRNTNAALRADGLDGIFGRVPYVRYKQDL